MEATNQHDDEASGHERDARKERDAVPPDVLVPVAEDR